MKNLCDICEGELVVEAGGKYAVCQVCGMKHSIERLREKMKTQSVAEAEIVPVVDEICDAEIVVGETVEEIADAEIVEGEIVDAEVVEGEIVEGEIFEGEIIDGEVIDTLDENIESRSAEQLHAEIAMYLKKPMFAKYSVKENVSIQVFGGDERCVPINFLIMKLGKPYLAVVILKSTRRKHGAVTGTMDICRNMGIRYVDFFASMPNTEQYVTEKILEALEK